MSAATLALEALEATWPRRSGYISDALFLDAREKHLAAIAALEAEAEAVQEPLVEITRHLDCYELNFNDEQYRSLACGTYPLYTTPQQPAPEIDRLEKRLAEIMPLFIEARDALPAISIASSKLHNVDLSLASRMDAVGTKDWRTS